MTADACGDVRSSSALTSLNPYDGPRVNGSCASASLNMYVASFQPPPRMKRRPSFTAFLVHSLALPAMSWVPYGPMPPRLATGTVPAFRKLLSGTVLCVRYVPAAWLHWYALGSSRPT